MLTLQIKEKEIENLTPEEEFVRGTVGAKCQINFDEFWQGYEKYIVFKRVGYEPINIMVNSLENEIEIPYTILAESGEFKIGVFGTTETETLPTLYSKDIKILYGTDTHGTTPPTYIPSEIDQLRLSKQDKLVSGENIKTVNGESVLGSGNIKIQVEVDQIYDPDSTNAQSGTAVDEALSGYVMAEVGKGLSSNDFTNEDKEKLYSALQNENIDKTYNPTSENAQSGLAVAQAVSAEQNRADNTFSNALKGSKSGSAILIDDISPVAHNMGVKISSNTVTDLTAVKVSRCGKNLFDNNKLSDWGLTLSDGKYTGDVGLLNEKTLFSSFKSNTRYTISVKASNLSKSSATLLIIINYTDGTNQTVIRVNSTTESVYSFTSTANANKSISNITSTFYEGDTINIAYIQIEEGTTATEYEPYEGAEYTPTADGTVNGVTSLYPNTTLMTDTEGVIIDCEYNRDINKAFAELQQAILSMGGNT